MVSLAFSLDVVVAGGFGRDIQLHAVARMFLSDTLKLLVQVLVSHPVSVNNVDTAAFVVGFANFFLAPPGRCLLRGDTRPGDSANDGHGFLAVPLAKLVAHHAAENPPEECRQNFLVMTVVMATFDDPAISGRYLLVPGSDDRIDVNNISPDKKAVVISGERS